MKKRAFLAAVLCAAAISAFAAVGFDYIDWVNGPVQFIMSKDELAQFRLLQSDTAAKAFIELFWARRDPTPDTPRNEAREQFEQRVAYADKNLADGSRKRGALTDRGKTWIIYGQPKRIERASTQHTSGPDLTGQLQRDQRTSDNWVQWIYEGEDVKTYFLVPKATIRFVDKMGTEDYRVERGSVDHAASQQRAIQQSILHPELKSPPVFTAAQQQADAAASAAPAAPVVVTTLTTPALTTAITDFKAAAKNPYENQISASWGEYVTSYGEYFVPVMLAIPQSAATAGADVTFFGVVEDASGTSVLAFEEPRKLTAGNGELYVDKSLALPAGTHRGLFGIAQNGKVLGIASTDMTLAGTLDKSTAAVSQLVLSNHVQPLTEAQAPTEPFAFGGVKVVPKADRTFRTSDDLWYFFELRNPGLADALSPDHGTATGAPPEQRPKIQVKMDVEGKDLEGKPIKRAAPPREVDPVPMKGVPGHYGVGNAIPLESFKPGDYTFTLKVIDTVNKQSYTLSQPFRVVK
ncbi:MAG TPA: GWxTD domain-containing protein [Thermoanaerobaculia bacterium]|nr:GWxTD domain-containing protein [Thermoanaerobaculia bacterium]